MLQPLRLELNLWENEALAVRKTKATDVDTQEDSFPRKTHIGSDSLWCREFYHHLGMFTVDVHVKVADLWMSDLFRRIFKT